MAKKPAAAATKKAAAKQPKPKPKAPLHPVPPPVSDDDPRPLVVEKGVALERLHPDPSNARKHGERNMQAIVASLKEHGQVEPLVVQRSSGRIIGGNGRYEAMRLLGWKQCLVAWVDIGDLAATKLGITLNRSAELAEWDLDTLDALLAELEDQKVDVGDMGFTADELDDLLGATDDADGVLDTEGLDGDDDVPEVPKNPITKPGDVWVLGEHRLMCGDSTSAEAVRTLMAGESADVVFTSPPYDQQRDYGAKIGDWLGLMRGVFAHVPPQAQVLVNLGLIHRDGEWVPYWDPWITWMREQGWRSFGWYVWDQGCGLPGSWVGRLAPSHEFIFHFNKKSGPVNKTKATTSGGRKFEVAFRGKDGATDYKSGGQVNDSKIPDSVVRINRHMARGIETGHPAVFPVALPAEVYAAFSDDGQITYEPFAGSGTTILAAQQINRRCYAMEIEPGYCDIAVQRWERLTGGKASRTGK